MRQPSEPSLHMYINIKMCVCNFIIIPTQHKTFAENFENIKPIKDAFEIQNCID